MDNRLSKAIRLIEDEARQLDQWAEESIEGSWSTHQVEPMRKRAAFLREKAKEFKVKAPT